MGVEKVVWQRHKHMLELNGKRDTQCAMWLMLWVIQHLCSLYQHQIPHLYDIPHIQHPSVEMAMLIISQMPWHLLSANAFVRFNGSKNGKYCTILHIYLYVYYHGPVATIGIYFHTTNVDEKKKWESNGKRTQIQTIITERSIYVLKFDVNLVSQSDYGLLSTITAIVLLHH